MTRPIVIEGRFFETVLKSPRAPLENLKELIQKLE